LEGELASRAKHRTATENRLKAIGHPLRGAILRILGERVASPAQMARELDEDVASVSHHTKELVRLECAELADERPGARGSMEHFYRATERHRIEADEWDVIAAENPEFAEHLVGEHMQAIVDDFASTGSLPIGRLGDFHITRTPIPLDEKGIKEAMEIYEDLRQAMLFVAERVGERGEKTVPFSSSLALFRVPGSSTGE
jgi:DNA-binding transcriptional ArsR family regulator